ncbi:hypothetical protein SAICODRAFT_25367 [Saitoella complicata NRRL Y-17804]|uniref:Pleckstrin homology domain-containing protein n=1 Tax=Saitoella complicata (strain BCRC 22490 / CBS 7301 / JCM 7358 / NBRC 10748 / NRRL Y-17804) TaxID=698492 RepID=A0A0E9NTU2_SAICN|nr:uncharacterized protein SAICODRAFT_25367 [Saitoella complicata NRRL Y-17804]ODQ53291.1 hypothetical protein SAICODRAFT_25367 [Saitoella complicata NRRL Y-17804]GAO52830.1 hypothetical protein G7K_6896-t1 [Saitoella complicata NRRL Y-17804]
MNGHRPFTTPDPASDPSSDENNDDDKNQVVLLTSNGRASRLSGIWSVDHQNPVPPQPQVVTTPALNVRPRPRSRANSAFGSVFGATGAITSRIDDSTNRRSSIASTSSSHEPSSDSNAAGKRASIISTTGSGGGVRTSISLQDGLQTSLLHEIHRLRSEREHLYSELQSLHASQHTLSHAHTTLSNQHRQLVGAYGNLEGVHEKLTGMLGVTSTALENSRGVCRELRRRVGGLEREVKEVDVLREKVQTLEDRALGEKGARAALLERIRELESTVAAQELSHQNPASGQEETASMYEDAASTSYPDSIPNSPLTPTMSMRFPSATLADELENVKVCVDREVQTEGWRSPGIEIRVEQYVEMGVDVGVQVETIPEREVVVKVEDAETADMETSTDAEAEYVTATSGIVSTSHTPPPLPPPKFEDPDSITSIDYRASTTTIRPLAERASTATIRPLNIEKIRAIMREADMEAPASTKASSPTLPQSPDKVSPTPEIETEPESDREMEEGRVVLLTSSTSPASPMPTKSITPLRRHRHRPDPLALEIRSPVAVEVQSPTFDCGVSPTRSFADSLEVMRSPGGGEGGWFEPEGSGGEEGRREGKGKEREEVAGGGWTEGAITDSPEKVPRGDKIPYPPSSSTASHEEGDSTVGLLRGEQTPPPPFPIPARKSSLRMRARRGTSSSSIPTKASQVLGITDVNGLGVATSDHDPLLEAKLAENNYSAKLDQQQQSVKKERLRMLHAEVEKEAWPQDRRSRLILSEALLDPDMDLSDLGLETPGRASAMGKPKPKPDRPPPLKSPHKVKSALELSRTNSPAINIVTPLTPPLPSPMPMPTVEPAPVIDAVASCMIGEMMYKYVRRKNGLFSPTRGMDDDDDFGGTGTRHKRWVWLSVSDMTICWAGRERVMREGGGKKLTILNVTEVKDYHSRPREIMQMARSIMITTPERSVTFTALSHEQHSAWMSALHFLVHHDPSELITYERNTPSPRLMYEPQEASSPSPARTDERSRQGSQASIEPVQRSGTDPLRPQPHAYGTPSPDARRPSLPVNLRQSVAVSSCSPVRLGTPKTSPTPPQGRPSVSSYRGMNKLNSAPPPNVPRFVAASPSGGRNGSLPRTEEEVNGREVGTLRMAAFVSSGDPFTGF